jgi:hypothetical protein
MPGWVLPAVAAELWGVPIEQVMADVAAGRLNSRVEGEFIFVDVQPDGADEPPSAPAPTPTPYRRSLAWSMPSDATAGSITSDPIVTADERDALLDEPAVNENLDAAWADADDANVDDDDVEDAAGLDAESEFDAEHEVDAPDGPIVLTADDIPNWGEVRSRVGRTRRPPRRILDAA